MQFKPATPTENIPIARLTSERWEMGIHPVMYGFRVRAGIVDAFSISVDYCAAQEMQFLPLLYLAIYRIMSGLPEDVSPVAVERMMPHYLSRPINHDPCWNALIELAAAAAPMPDVTEVQQLLDLIRSDLTLWRECAPYPYSVTSNEAGPLTTSSFG